MPGIFPKSLDFEATWNVECQEKLNVLFGPDSLTNSTTISAMDLYSSLYRLCTSTPKNYIDEVYRRLGHLFVEKANAAKDRIITPSIMAYGNKGIIELYCEEWRSFSLAAKKVDAISYYLNRVVEKMVEAMGENGSTITMIVGDKIGDFVMRPVGVLGLHVWRHVVLHHLEDNCKNVLVKGFLQLIEDIRMGKVSNVQTALNELESVGRSFYECDPPEYTIASPQLTKPIVATERRGFFYETGLLDPFLQATSAFYDAESNKRIKEHEICEYIYYAESRLRLEIELAGRLFPIQVHGRIMSMVEEKIILNHSAKLKGDFGHLLLNGAEEDLSAVFNLLCRVPEGTDSLLKSFESFAEIRLSFDPLSYEAGNKEHIIAAYIQLLSATLRQLEGVHRTCFKSDERFKACIEGALRKLASLPVPHYHGTTANFLFEALDYMLRDKLALSMESMLDTIHVACLLPEKEPFIEGYIWSLAGRLLHSPTPLPHRAVELELIKLIGERFGNDIGTRVQKMFQDVDEYHAYLPDLRKELEARNFTAIQVSPKVLTYVIWPIQEGDKSDYVHDILPEELIPYEAALKKSTSLQRAHANQKITLINHLSRIELAHRCGDRDYVFEVTIPQAKTLFFFNQSDSIGVERLETELQINSSQLSSVVSPMTEVGLLRWSEEEGKHLRYNREFYSVKTRLIFAHVGLGPSIPITGDISQESEISTAHAAVSGRGSYDSITTEMNLSENRKYYLQSTMIRVLKEANRLSPARLYQLTRERATASGSCQRFSPTNEHLHACVSQLIDKQYLEHDEKNDLYLYIP